MSFPDKLRMLIEERDIRQKQLALDLGIPASTMGGYVQGKSEPDFETLKLIAGFFGVSPNYLLDVPDKRAADGMEDEVLRIFRSLTPEQRELYIEQGRAFLRVNMRKSDAAAR